jgi:hypothetical protein
MYATSMEATGRGNEAGIAAARPHPSGVSEPLSAVVGLAFGGFLAFLVLANAEADEPRAMRIALAVQYCAPGVLALLARRRPSLYLVAGVVGMIVPFTAMSGVAMPLIVPAGMSLVAYGRRADEARARLADPVLAILSLFLVIASLASLSAHQDPFCHTGPNFSDCGTDEVTSVEAAASLAFSVAVIVAPFALAKPKRSTRPHA